MPGVIVACSAAAINVGLNQVLIHGAGSWPGLHYIGSPIATSITNWFLFAALLMYTMGIRGYHKKTWPGWAPATVMAGFTRSRVSYVLLIRVC